jgi:hypothetical protein
MSMTPSVIRVKRRKIKNINSLRVCKGRVNGVAKSGYAPLFSVTPMVAGAVQKKCAPVKSRARIDPDRAMVDR